MSANLLFLKSDILIELTTMLKACKLDFASSKLSPRHVEKPDVKHEDEGKNWEDREREKMPKAKLLLCFLSSFSPSSMSLFARLHKYLGIQVNK